MGSDGVSRLVRPDAADASIGAGTGPSKSRMSPVVFDAVGMSTPSTHALETARVGGHLGEVIRAERRRRGWTLRDLAARTGLSPSHLQWIEAGNAASVQAYAAIAGAFGRRLEIDLVDPRSRSARRPDEDPVHAAMGEVEAARLARPGIDIALDEPYQHFQFAGRGDLVAWSIERGALLHLENRTRFPNVQDTFGAYNAKRRWLANAVAERLGRRTAMAVGDACDGRLVVDRGHPHRSPATRKLPRGLPGSSTSLHGVVGRPRHPGRRALDVRRPRSRRYGATRSAPVRRPGGRAVRSAATSGLRGDAPSTAPAGPRLKPEACTFPTWSNMTPTRSAVRGTSVRGHRKDRPANHAVAPPGVSARASARSTHGSCPTASESRRVSGGSSSRRPRGARRCAGQRRQRPWVASSQASWRARRSPIGTPR